MSIDQHGTDRVDELLRTVVVDELDRRGDEFERARECSRWNNRRRVRTVTTVAANERQSTTARRLVRRPRWRAVGIVAGVACAALVAVALWPTDDSTSNRGALPGITDTATAAEVLDAAGRTLLVSGSTAGSGDVWHGVSRTYRNGTLVSVNEQWFDSTSDRNLLAAWGRDRSPDDVPPGAMPKDGDVKREVLIVDRVDEDGVQRLRRFERPVGESWQFPPGDLDPTRAMDLPPGDADRQRQLANAMRDWLEVASRPDAKVADLRAATRAFSAAVPDYFSAQPEDDFGRVRDAVPARQVAYLLTTVQASPAAVAALYSTIGGLDSLERLDDVRIDGRRAYRLRFDMSDPTIMPTRERVLVVDAETGRIVRTETLDRSAWTEVVPAERVEHVGDDAELCTGTPDVDCGLLEGEGSVARTADTFATDMAVRYAVHAENRRLKQQLGDAAPPVMCRQMTPLGACDPQDEEEARRIDAIAADPEKLRETTHWNNSTPFMGDDTAFSTNVPLSAQPDTDGIWRSQGQCFRDWRVLTICRG